MSNEVKEALDAFEKKFADEANETKTALAKEQKSLAEKLDDLAKKSANGEDVTDIQTRLKDSQDELTKLGDSMVEMTKAMNRRDEGQMSAARTIAESKGFAENIRAGQRMEFKDITTGDFGTVTEPAGVRVGRRGLIDPVNRRLMIRDVLPIINVDFASWSYLQETGYTNNAAVVAEATLKPQSELEFTPKQGNVKKMAHWFRVSEEILDDTTGMEGYINERGIYGLLLKEEGQLVNGNGSATQLDGMLKTGNFTAYVPATVAEAATDIMDDIRVAMAQVEQADLMADVIMMNHLDAAALSIAKDADGKYLHPAFTGNAAWGLPIVSTKAIAQGNFLVAGIRGNVSILQKRGIEVRRSTEDRDNFVTNMVTILIEERLNLEVIRPEGVVYGAISVPVP